MPAGPSQLFVVAWGGALARVGADHSPLAGRQARFIVHPLFLWSDPADDDRLVTLGRSIRDDLQPWSVGATYPNFLGEEGRERMGSAFGTSTPRMMDVKGVWDPHEMFRTHQAIRSTTTDRRTRHAEARDGRR